MRARLALLLALAAAAAAAQLLVPAPELPPGAESKWQQALAANEAALERGQWDRAATGAQRVLDQMVATIAHGEGTESLFARAALGRGLARAGLGQHRDAVWDYWLASALDPQLEKADLSSYGDTGSVLKERALAEAKLFARTGHGCSGADCDGFVRAQEELAPEPVFPRKSVRRCTPGLFRVSSVIGEDGLLHLPGLAEVREGALSFVVLDTLRKYRYRPATLDGKPVAVRFELTIRFRGLPKCETF